MALTGFDKEYYLNAKLAALKTENASLWADKDTAYLDAVLTGVYGLSAEDHYNTYGYQEGLSANAWFDTEEYETAKAVQMFNTGQYASVAEALEVFNAAWPYNPYLHYLDYGAAEGINPSNNFDESEYLSDKLAALQTYDSTKTEWEGKAVSDLRSFLAGLGMTALDHYLSYGQNEGLSVTAVTGDERVTVSSSGSQDPENPGDSITLTVSSDILSGDDSDNSFNGPTVNNLQTLNGGDVLDGKDGSDLLFGQLTNIAVVAPTVSNIETLQFNAGFAGGATYDASKTTGMEKVENIQSTTLLSVINLDTLLTNGLSVSNAAAGTVLSFENDALSGSSDTMVITLDGAYGAENIIRIGSEADPDGDIENLTIMSTGASSDLGTGYIDMDEVTRLTISAKADIDLGSTPSFEALTTLDASSSSAGITLTLANKTLAGTDVTLTGGSGNDFFDVSAMDDKADLSVDLGAGDDTIAVTKTNVQTDWQIDGGSGTNIIQTDQGITVTSVFSNFQALAFKGSSAVTQDMSNVPSTITAVYINVDGNKAVTITNLDDGDVVTLQNDKTLDDGAAVTLRGDAGVNTITLILDDDADQGVDVDDPDGGLVIDSNIQKINLITTSNQSHSLDLNESSALAEIVISGGGNLDLRGAGDTVSLNDTTTNVDASAATGSVAAIAGGSDTVFSGGSAADRFTGGAGDDTLAGNSGDDVLDGGAGTNTITGHAGADSITASGTDTLVYTEMTDGTSAKTITSLVTDVDDLSAAKADDINSFTSGSDTLAIQGALQTALNAIGTVDNTDVVLSAAADAFNYDAATVFIISSGVGTAEIGDVSALALLFNDTLSAGKQNVSAGQEILFTAEDAGGETGIYYFKDVDGSGEISAGDVIALLGVADSSLADGDFSF